MEPAAVFCLDSESLPKARALSTDLNLPLVEATDFAAKSTKHRLRFFHDRMAIIPALAFIFEADTLQLAWVEEQRVLAIHAGFHGPGMDYRREKGGGRSEMIARAVGLKAGRLPSVIDATAGLGVDAFVLAGLGCEVTMLERVPAVGALLQDGLERSRVHASDNDPELQSALTRLQLIQADATVFLNDLHEADFPDVVYLDPMFPERRKSAAVKKEMQIFHRLIGPDEDVARLFEAALTVARERVVVKRPRIAPALTDREPGHVIEGKRNRYDIYSTR